MRLPHKTLERKLFKNGYRHVIGVDEVGMACLAGPVFVCAVSFNEKFYKRTHRELKWLRDSKLLLPHQREKFFDSLTKEKNMKFHISYSNVKTIDQLNIYQAARSAMKRAIEKLKPGRDSIVLVDGKGKIAGISLEQKAIVKGDRKVFAIACASILAKVARDRVMKKYAEKYPDYGFERHKGYPTKLHKAKLAEFGPCEIHRRSFARLSFWTEKNNELWLSPKT